jgi:hypothetical protein
MNTFQLVGKASVDQSGQTQRRYERRAEVRQPILDRLHGLIGDGALESEDGLIRVAQDTRKRRR